MEKELATGEGFLKKPLNLIDRKSVWERIQKAGLTESEVGYLWMDDSLGLILDKLDKLGIADNTMIFFCSDNGPARQGSPRHIGTAKNLKGYKHSLNEGGIRLPGRAARGGRRAAAA